MSTEARHAPVPPRPVGPARGDGDSDATAPAADGPPAQAAPGVAEGPARTAPDGATTAEARGASTGSAASLADGSPRAVTGGGAVGPETDLRAGRGTGFPSPRTGSATDDPRTTTAARPRFPDFRPPSLRTTPPTTPPPPLASARLPDPEGRGPADGTSESAASRDGATAAPLPGEPAIPGRRGYGNIPPRPGHRPPTAAREGRAPVETPSETTTRLRPVSVQSPSPGGPGGSGVPGSPDDTRNRPTGRPQRPAETAWTAVPPRPPFDAPQRNGAAGTSRTQPPGAFPHAAAAFAGTPPPAAGVPAAPDPALSWSAAMAPGTTGLGMGFGDPEGYDRRARATGRLVRPRVAAAAACLVLGIGLIGGAVTGSWLTGEPGSPGAASGFAAAGAMWHSVPVDQLFPPTVDGRGAGPGGADRTWTRVAVAPDSGCAGAFDPLLRKVLAPVGCARLLRATYTDATQSYVTTVGLLFTKADASAMTSLATRYENEGLARRTDLVPRPYAAKGTVAAAFGDEQRAAWTVSVLTEAPVVVYAVSGWADGRAAGTPQAAADATKSGATTPVAQAGLGNEAQGLADSIERGLRQTVKSATEEPS